MESRRIIINIGVEHIHPHPENPRKDLGDLTELAESIKKNGVMQNLTVIPKEGEPGEYIAIIGHRRHAAAKLAGVAEVPCRIIEGMTEREQMSTMLEENMQRNDLTIFEQAQGFQMMLDLGETEDSIAEKTGFSKRTIKRRLNIAKLNQEELKKKEQDESFQLTLKDLYELEKVEDIKTRDKILKEARDSRDLVWRAQSAVREAEKQKKTKQIVEMLEPLGVKKAPKGAENEMYSGKWETIKEIEFDKELPKEIKLKKQTEPVYYLPYYRGVRIIKKAKKEKKEATPEEIRRKKIDKNKKEIKAKMAEMNARRKDFIMNIISGKIDAIKEATEVKDMIWNVLMNIGTGLYPSYLTNFITGKSEYELSQEEKDEVNKKIEQLPIIHQMLIITHKCMENIGDIYDYYGSCNKGRGSSLMKGYEIWRSMVGPLQMKTRRSCLMEPMIFTQRQRTRSKNYLTMMVY